MEAQSSVFRNSNGLSSSEDGGDRERKEQSLDYFNGMIGGFLRQAQCQ